MTQHEKDILISKADALRWSFADTRLQAIMGVVSEVIRTLPVDDKPTLGFGAKIKETKE